LIPAFLLAGGIVTFISRESIIGYLGAAARKTTSFGIASIASFFVAACSCTVIPVASGIYYGGAGIGAAFIILWVAPAANILALSYTGQILGGEIVIARVVLALLMAFIVGTVMALVFRKEERNRISKITATKGPLISRRGVILLLLVLAWLLSPNYIVTHGPYWHKVIIWAIGLVIISLYVWKCIEWEKVKTWIKETWWFVRIIFPLLLAGVFIVGIIGVILPVEWVQTLVGGEGIRQSFIGSIFGSVMYMATMTEAPFVNTLMVLGMGKGAAMALLLTGPGLSIPSWLAISRVFGIKKALVYIPTIIILGTLAGWVAGYIL